MFGGRTERPAQISMQSPRRGLEALEAEREGGTKRRVEFEKRAGRAEAIGNYALAWDIKLITGVPRACQYRTDRDWWQSTSWSPCNVERRTDDSGGEK